MNTTPLPRISLTENSPKFRLGNWGDILKLKLKNTAPAPEVMLKL